ARQPFPLTRLGLCAGNITTEGLYALARAPFWEELTHLRLDLRGALSRDPNWFWIAPPARGLEYLRLEVSFSRGNNNYLIRIAEVPWEKLSTLSLTGLPHPDEPVDPLLDSPWLAGLRRLRLDDCSFRRGDLDRLLLSPQL